MVLKGMCAFCGEEHKGRYGYRKNDMLAVNPFLEWVDGFGGISGSSRLWVCVDCRRKYHLVQGLR